ncbi:PsbP domain-containing protein [Cephalotus follicularis]|uniref:PsbP domain-containing protein n=1 Tax=Cephalotus follicularis TaxID=3775 RepID=A0A1Q3D3V0_CEPFO|nr:PsbP domain-containing protein [Cephalotus follicularis]
MALQHYIHACKNGSINKICMTQSSNGQQKIYPQEQFGMLASEFRRRLLVGIGSGSLVAVGANFGGITSFLLGLSPESGRNLKLDVLYSIGGYSRCIKTTEGFEFIYPSSWVGDQTLLYREAERRELERSLDPPPLNSNGRRRNLNEPVVAFGPPGSSGELNVSVIVSPILLDFSIEALGGPNKVGEAVVKTITGSRRVYEVKGTLLESTLREDPSRNVKYYKLEFKVESPSFQRHNIAVCCARGGRLYTLNAQAPESAWPKVKSDFNRVADSFILTT